MNGNAVPHAINLLPHGPSKFEIHVFHVAVYCILLQDW